MEGLRADLFFGEVIDISDLILRILSPSVAEAEFGAQDTGEDLRADSLFGEVIDISDLIPRFLSPSVDVPALPLPVTEAGFGAQDTYDFAVVSNQVVLTILYDDDMLGFDGSKFVSPS